jgi:hypothetical protein
VIIGWAAFDRHRINLNWRTTRRAAAPRASQPTSSLMGRNMRSIFYPNSIVVIGVLRSLTTRPQHRG